MVVDPTTPDHRVQPWPVEVPGLTINNQYTAKSSESPSVTAYRVLQFRTIDGRDDIIGAARSHHGKAIAAMRLIDPRSRGPIVYSLGTQSYLLQFIDQIVELRCPCSSSSQHAPTPALHRPSTQRSNHTKHQQFLHYKSLLPLRRTTIPYRINHLQIPGVLAAYLIAPPHATCTRPPKPLRFS